jgi:hypothetical protein
MTNKIPKKLMREFGAITLPDYEQNSHTGFSDEFWKGTKATGFEYKSLSDLQTIIDLAAEWCRKQDVRLGIQYHNSDWRWHIFIKRTEASGINLPKAIMAAVVAAAKEVKDA